MSGKGDSAEWARDAIENAILRQLKEGWKPAKEVADAINVSRRGIGQRLHSMEKRGLVKSRSTGERPSFWSDPPPKEWMAA